jgi:hypothetical protein
MVLAITKLLSFHRLRGHDTVIPACASHEMFVQNQRNPDIGIAGRVVSKEHLMSRVVLALAAGGMAALFSLSALAAMPLAKNGIPIAPNGGNASVKQWGGVDDAFAVNPDGDADAAIPPRHHSAITEDQSSQDSDSDGDPDADHDGEVLPI